VYDAQIRAATSSWCALVADVEGKVIEQKCIG